MAGTVTGRDANLWFCAHSGGASLATIATKMASRTHSNYGLGDFSLTLDKGIVEQELIGEVGNFFTQGSLSMDGSLVSVKFAASGTADFLLNVIDACSEGKYQYLAISGSVSDATDSNYLTWFLVSCQVTGYDVSIGDADTITEASIDYTVMDPFNVTYKNPCITDA